MIKAINDKLIFIILIIFAIAASVTLKNENFFDLANYHYYNPWAFLNGRIGYDIVPASFLTFLNPLLDIPRYFTIVYFNEHVDLFYAINGLWFGFLLFVFYRILKLFFNNDCLQDYLWILFSLAIAITGRMTWFQVGASTNEIILAFINFCGLFLILRNLQSRDKQKLRDFIFAGFILGVGLGLKGTNITICTATGISLIIGFKWLCHPIKFIFMFALAGLFGYLLCNGWWMYKLWMLYDNPFFPFFNGIFHSEYFEASSISFDNFTPTWKQLVICPYLAFKRKICNGETLTNDLRLQIFYIIAIGWLLYLFFSSKIKYYYVNKPMAFFFYLFLLFDYLLWAKLLGIQHYFIVIEMCGAILVTQSLRYWYVTKKYRRFLYASICYLGFLLLSVPFTEHDFGNLKGHDKIINVEPIKLPKHTLIKLYNLPLAGLLPEIAKYNNDFRAVGISTYIDIIPSTLTDMSSVKKFKEQIDFLDEEYKNQVVIFRLSSNIKQKSVMLDRMDSDLKGKKCQILENSFAPIFEQPIYICIPEEWKQHTDTVIYLEDIDE